MVRNYIRKRKKTYEWNEEKMKLAAEKILKGHSVKSVATEFGIPRSTLQKKLHKNENGETEKRGFRRTFNEEQEQALYAYIVDAKKKSQKLSNVQVRKLAFKFAEKLNLRHNFKKDQGLAGKEWMYYFMKRHKQSCDQDEEDGSTETDEFNNETAAEFHNLVETIILEKKIKPENEDETNVTDFIVFKNDSKNKRGYNSQIKEYMTILREIHNEFDVTTSSDQELTNVFQDHDYDDQQASTSNDPPLEEPHLNSNNQQKILLEKVQEAQSFMNTSFFNSTNQEGMSVQPNKRQKLIQQILEAQSYMNSFFSNMILSLTENCVEVQHDLINNDCLNGGENNPAQYVFKIV